MGPEEESGFFSSNSPCSREDGGKAGGTAGCSFLPHICVPIGPRKPRHTNSNPVPWFSLQPAPLGAGSFGG